MPDLITTRTSALRRAATEYARVMPNAFEGNRQLVALINAMAGARSQFDWISAEAKADLRTLATRAARNATDDGNPAEFAKAASVLVARIENYLEAIETTEETK